MQITVDIEKKLRELKPMLKNDFSVQKIGYFGSYVNQEQTERSDLDILVEFSEPIGWKFFTLEKFLENKIGIKIDLVTHNALKKQLKDSILTQVKYL